MNHPPKLVPPLRLYLLLLLCMPLLHALPAYPSFNQANAQQNNYVRNLEKGFFQPPQLEETIDEVQKILEQDPTLPRLTRGEIEELYEKVTREEYEKSIEAGDMGRADSMRALMLVLPYNTDNNTEDNLQELYTRPPVTKVIDGYSQPVPIKFVTADPNSAPKAETASIGNLAATTYKPSFAQKIAHSLVPRPTTYHPAAPPIMYQMTPSVPETIMQFQPVTSLPLAYDYSANVERAQTQKSTQRFSSHYNAKTAEFMQRKPARAATTTIKPVADVLESLGIVGQQQQLQYRQRYPIDDYYVAESAPKPVVSSYVPQTVNVAELKGLRSQSLAAKIRPDAYASFKPLNIGEEIRAKPEVEGYLTRFGIVGGRKRKELEKNIKLQTLDEQISEESEIATAKIPRGRTKVKKSAQGTTGNSQLEKLLENLQELERLNVKPKSQYPITTTTPRPTTTTTTTTTTTPVPATAPSFITNGVPLLIEPKKPRRRIDPNLDINYGASGNQQPIHSSSDQLAKLLENLQELEKLKINPENVLKTAKPNKVAIPTKPAAPVTTAPPQPVRTQSLSNRFSDPAFFQQQQLLRATKQNDADQLQRVLKELQAFEQANAKTSTTTTTTSTTKYPSHRGNLALNDFSQLRQLLGDERELERLYEQARRKIAPSTTSTTTTTTSTTKKPAAPGLSELEQLQKYLAELDRARPTTTSSTTTSSTTTTTTTRKPPISTADLAQRITGNLLSQRTKKPAAAVDSEQLQELINRVQELERVNNRKAENAKASTTESSIPYMGFTTRNVNEKPKATANDYRIQTNDFAHLQQLYKQVQEAEQATFGHIEISTAATASKIHNNQQNGGGGGGGGGKRTQDFAQRIIDITNDTGSGSSLQEVDPNDFVQLQKLLSKVQELERVKINADGIVTSVTPNPRPKSQREATVAPNLVTSASVVSTSVQNLNGAQFVYPEKAGSYKEFADMLGKEASLDELRIDVPAYQFTTSKPHTSKKAGVSAEELRELALAAAVPASNQQKPAIADKEFEQYQQFLRGLGDSERNSYINMQPPMIQKTVGPVTKEPPRFIATRKPEDVAKNRRTKEDLEELQKLLNNAQELEKLGITLPKQLSQQIETKLTKTSNLEEAFKELQMAAVKPTTLASAERLDPPEVEEYLTKYGILESNEQKEQKQQEQYRKEQKQLEQYLKEQKQQEQKREEQKQEEQKQEEQKQQEQYLKEQKQKEQTQTEQKQKEQYLQQQKARTVTQPTTSKAEATSAEWEDLDSPRQKTVVFSLTTMKSLTPREPKPPATESTLELPIFSATKIIEAAIKRAANKIGVSTEQSLGFRRRSDEDVFDTAAEDGDIMGEFSELNYQLAEPEINPARDASLEVKDATKRATNESEDNSMDLKELQRLIGNLQELQKLNINVSSDVLKEADKKYLESFKSKQPANDDETKKNRRQSATPSSSTTNEAATAASTTAAPTRISLDLSLGDADMDTANSGSRANSAASSTTTEGSTTSTTEESRNGSLADLENSFGPDPITETPLPPKKKNGFYFLADWNSFLEVGDGDDQVVVRLSPKIGDPRDFIPVKIP